MSLWSCPICSEDTRCIDSRNDGERTRRRYKCPRGHRFTTAELIVSPPNERVDFDTWLESRGARPQKQLDELRDVLRSLLNGSTSPT